VDTPFGVFGTKAGLGNDDAPMRFARPPVRLVVAVSVLTLASVVQAQPAEGPLADYAVTTWNENDGLPAGRIRAIEQDTDGYLWLGTDAGLVRFDGVRFSAWSSLGDARLPVGAVTALLHTRDAALWVGVSGGTPLGRIKDGKLSLFGERDGLGASYVLSLLEDSHGTIWAGTFQGLFRGDGTRWHKVSPEVGLGAGSVLALYEDRQRRIWAATQHAVYRKEAAQDHFEQVDVITISSNVWQRFSEDASGRVWISDFSEGFRSAGHTPSRPAHPPRRGWGVDLLHDRRGNFWVGTQGQGLWRVRGAQSGNAARVEIINVEDGLASNAVQSLLEDREGNIWLGTLAGLQRLTPHQVTPVKHLAIPRAIEVTPDGSVWVGTAAGLVRFSSAGRRVYTEADGLPGTVVLALHADRRGDLWVSAERGVVRFSQGRFSPVLVAPGPAVQRILTITGTRDALWFRDFYLRLFRWRNGQLSPADDIPETHRRTASSLDAGRSGTLYIGSSGGLLLVSRPGHDPRTYDPQIGAVGSVLEDSRGNIWVGGDKGLSRLTGDRFITVTGENGFPGEVKSIVEDAQGLIWVGAGNGILRLEPGEVEKVGADRTHQVRYRLFNTADGVAGVPYNEGRRSALRSPDGRLWFITSSGVTIVDPRSIGPDPAPPSVRIESVAADTRAFDPGGPLQLPASTSHLQIGFTALTLSDPVRVRFRYRLDGYDRDWVDAGAGRQATYTNLPPRQYQFRVAASAGDGTWGETSAPLAFGIQPMFYQTGWFYFLCGLSMFLIVYASWRLHVRQVRRQFALVLAERIRMSRAIHDTLLQGLAALALQVDDLSHNSDLSSPAGKKRILAVRRQVEGYIRQARRSILDLRTPTLASRDLPQALREAAERVIGARPVELDVTVKGTPHTCAASIEEQLLLIGQEAVNNAVMHGQASRVAVELDYREDQMSLRVADDGCGFDPAAAMQTPGHYGLVSMRERAGQVRGRLTIASTPGSGTEIETVVPV
jgi:ligand-binding sensor domain-containing protein/two-component sensor histidine kinase